MEQELEQVREQELEQVRELELVMEKDSQELLLNIIEIKLLSSLDLYLPNWLKPLQWTLPQQ